MQLEPVRMFSARLCLGYRQTGLKDFEQPKIGSPSTNNAVKETSKK